MHHSPTKTSASQGKAEMGIYILLLLLLLLVSILSLPLIFKNKAQQKNHHPPSPPGLPIIGNMHQITHLSHQSFHQLSKKHGPVMLLQLGRVPILVVSSTDAAKDVLKTNDLVCCSRPAMVGSGRLTYNYVDIAFAPYGDYWRHMRKISVLELFSLKRVQSFMYIREQEINYIIKLLSESAASGVPVNLSEMLYSLTASIVFRMAFGRSFRGSDFDNHRFMKMVHEAEAVLGSFSAKEMFPFVGWIVDWFFGRQGKIEQVFVGLNSIFQQVIDEHLVSGRTPEEDDIIDVLLKLVRDQPTGETGAPGLNNDNIKAILLNIFLGGVDTGAITVIWAMVELIRNPTIMKKVQDEVRNFTKPKGIITENEIDHFHYLKMVIKETLRLHPPAPLLLPRTTTSHCTIGGFHVNAQTLIHVNAWAIGRDPKYWDDPEIFCPERFLETNIDFKGQNFEFLPFGSGRRVCPGMHMGMVTVELALANLLYWFDWKVPVGEDDIDMEEAAGLTASKRTALWLVPVKIL